MATAQTYSDLELKGLNKSAEINERTGVTPNHLNVQSGWEPQTTPIYIYNVGPLEFGEAQGIKRIPNHPHLFLKKCPTDKKYILVGSITNPFPIEDFDSNGNRFVRWENGYKEATRMLNPENPTLTDQDWTNPAAEFRHQKDNLNAFGLFWSVNCPPLDEEVAAARKRMEATFQKELKVMAEYESQGVPLASMPVTRTAHAAAEYFSTGETPLNFSWHRTDLRVKNEIAGKIECPACFNLIHPKAATCTFCDAVFDEERAKKFHLGPYAVKSAGRQIKEFNA